MPVASAILNPADPNPPVSCDCIHRVQIVNNPTGGSLIAWGMPDGFNAKGPYHFYIDFGRSGTSPDEWQPLNKIPVIDDCVFMDHVQRQYDHLADYYYRIRLVLPNEIDSTTGKCKVCLSQPWQANMSLSKRDWLVAREICRKEYLMQRKRTNLTAVGYVLKLRRWGQPCAACREFDTQEVQADCRICYGTGFTGGYFKGIQMVFTMDAPWHREFKREEPVGVTNNMERKGRTVTYPYLDTHDVFVRRDNGERYYIKGIDQVAEVGGVPIVCMASLRLAPSTDRIYDIPSYGGSSSSQPTEPGPLPCPVPSSSSSSSSQKPPDCDYRTGLKDEGDW